MIEEILKAVAEAEAEADKVVKEAYQKGREIYIEAEAAAEKVRAEAQSLVKTERKKALFCAEEEAKAESSLIIAQGKKECDNLNVDISKSAKLIEERLLKKYDC